MARLTPEPVKVAKLLISDNLSANNGVGDKDELIRQLTPITEKWLEDNYDRAVHEYAHKFANQAMRSKEFRDEDGYRTVMNVPRKRVYYDREKCTDPDLIRWTIYDTRDKIKKNYSRLEKELARYHVLTGQVLLIDIFEPAV